MNALGPSHTMIAIRPNRLAKGARPPRRGAAFIEVAPAYRAWVEGYDPATRPSRAPESTAILLYQLSGADHAAEEGRDVADPLPRVTLAALRGAAEQSAKFAREHDLEEGAASRAELKAAKLAAAATEPTLESLRRACRALDAAAELRRAEAADHLWRHETLVSGFAAVVAALFAEGFLLSVRTCSAEAATGFF